MKIEFYKALNRFPLLPSGIAVVSGLSLGEGLGKDGRECDEEDLKYTKDLS